MAKNQGLLRLRSGISRKITKSEKTRGYIFVSMDTALADASGSHPTIVIDGVNIGVRKIDKYGRFFPRLSYSKSMKSYNTVKMKYFENENLLDLVLK